jgi:uncharacterized membrane protein YqjE
MSESGGLMVSLQRLAGSLLAVVQTRLELLSNEMEEERLRILQMLLYGSVTLMLFGLALALLTAFFVMLFWDSQRLAVLGIFTALYSIGGLLAWNALRRVTGERPRLFSASVDEMTDDRAQLEQRP